MSSATTSDTAIKYGHQKCLKLVSFDFPATVVLVLLLIINLIPIGRPSSRQSETSKAGVDDQNPMSFRSGRVPR
jgi:hypothetical protein